MDFVKLENALELREFLNGIPASELRTIYLEKRDSVTQVDQEVRGIKLLQSPLSDGSEVLNYSFV